MAWSNTSAYDAVLNSKQVIISEAYHLPDPNDPVEVEENELSAAWYGDMMGGPNDHDPREPVRASMSFLNPARNAFVSSHPKLLPTLEYVRLLIFTILCSTPSMRFLLKILEKKKLSLSWL
jgi:hypothetical protein